MRSPGSPGPLDTPDPGRLDTPDPGPLDTPDPGPLGSLDSLDAVTGEVVVCRACPRLVSWREQVARERRAAFRDDEYWGRPVPGFGDPAASLLVVGLAPAAHGGNRTGRIFTGDRSGDWVFRALHRAGYANQPMSVRRGDGLQLTGAYVTAAVRCAPPANRPTPGERDTCRPFLERELALLHQVQVIVALGQFAYETMARLVGIRPRPRFGHGLEVAVPEAPTVAVPAELAVPPRLGRTLLCSYHPSQQNTFTGTLTEAMFDAVFARARELSRPGR